MLAGLAHGGHHGVAWEPGINLRTSSVSGGEATGDEPATVELAQLSRRCPADHVRGGLLDRGLVAAAATAASEHG